MSSFHLPIRLAAAGPPPLPEETTATPETPSPSALGLAYGPGPGPGLGAAPPPAHISGSLRSPSPLVAEYGDSVKNGQNGDVMTFGVSEELRKEAAAGSSNHQFWLKDAKIAEDLFTIHRSARHLLEFTSSMIGNHDPSLGHRPIPVMSDADVLFMSQLSNDIARGVGGISAVRNHGQRARKRKARDVIPISGPGSRQGDGDEEVVRTLLTREHSSYHRSRGSRTERTSAPKRLHLSKSDDEMACQKCGRSETPEWRKGPEGLLCNVCGLVYKKQKRKSKGS